MEHQSICNSCHSLDTLVYELEAGGDVCMACGALSADTSSSLVALGRANEDGIEHGRNYLHSGGTSYAGGGKDIRGAGHSQTYQELAKAELEIFIRSLLGHYKLSALTGRVKHIFYGAKAKESFRWGRRARVVAAACVYIVASERNSNISPEDIARMADCEARVIQHAQAKVKRYNDIYTGQLSPQVYIDQLVAHFKALVARPSPRLSGHKTKTSWDPSTLAFLRKLNYDAVRTLAAGVLEFGSDVSLAAGRTPSSVAIAAIVVAMEGVARTPAPMSKDIMTEMTSQLDVPGIFTGAERYRDFVRLLNDYASRLAWIAKPVTKKVLVQNTEAIVKLKSSLAPKYPGPAARAASASPPLPPGSMSLTNDAKEESEAPNPPLAMPDVPPTFNLADPVTSKRPAEYMRTRPARVKRVRMIETAAGSLLSAISSTDPSLLSPSQAPRPRPLATHDPETINARQRLLLGETASAIFVDEASAPSPTRLDRLLLVRKCESNITDDELFSPDELESLVRTDDEARLLSRTERYRTMLEYEPPPESDSTRRRKRRQRSISSGVELSFERKTKVNQAMKDNVARLLADEGDGWFDVGDGEERPDVQLGMQIAMGGEDNDGEHDDREEDEEDAALEYAAWAAAGDDV